MDATAIAAGANAIRSGIETLKTALDIALGAGELLPDGDRKDQVGAALATATRKLEEGEAAIAHAPGCQSCRCQFPPTPMLRVGHLPYRQLSDIDQGAVPEQHAKAGGSLTGVVAVHACPKCKRTDAPAYPDFVRDGQPSFFLPLLARPLEPPPPAPSRSSEGWGW